VQHGDEGDEAHAHHKHDDLFWGRGRDGKEGVRGIGGTFRERNKMNERHCLGCVRSCADRETKASLLRTGVIFNPGESSV